MHYLDSPVLSLVFQLVTTYHPPKSQYASALKVCNHMKNKSPDHLATDSSRVYLNPTSDAEGSDYINASWLMGEEADLLAPARRRTFLPILPVIVWRRAKAGRLDAKLSNEMRSQNKTVNWKERRKK